MKTLIRKELRENFKVALIGLALFAFIQFENYRSSTDFFAGLARGQYNWNYDQSEPLLSGSVISSTGLFCAIFGALLGWLQIHSERHRDLWAFLVHRPLARTKIFAAKAVAGLCLYTLAAGLPLLGLIVMTRLPGHIAAPFEWVMVLPVLALFLSGIVFYFAGMLTGLRQARWYVSRGLGLGAALIVSASFASAPEFSRALVMILVVGAVLAAAAWGSFVSGGLYEGQPGLGRRALAGSLMLGCLVVVGLAMALLESQLPREPDNGWSRYQITKDGGIYKMTQPAGKTLEITELNGAPLKDAKTGHPITGTDFNLRAAPECGVLPVFPDPAKVKNGSSGGFLQTTRYFTLWRQTADTLWYWNPNGRLWGYDIASRRFIGSLGPDGFAPKSTTRAARFSRPEGQTGSDYYNASYPARTLFTDQAVYQLDLDHRTTKLFFAANQNDRIGGATDVSLLGTGWDNTFVVTTNFISLLTPDGNLVWQTPFTPAYPDYFYIAVSFLEPSNRFVICFNPRNELNKTNTLPSHYVWLAAGQGALTNLDVPSIARTWTLPWNERLIGLGLPPASWLVVTWLYGQSRLMFLPWPELQLSLAMAVVCAIAGWWLGRRYHFTAASQLKWAVFHLLTGLPGLLAFLCVQEWPAREPCPNCQKLRLVDREKCEYCGAAFAPPPKIGTEIFEPVSATNSTPAPAAALRE